MTDDTAIERITLYFRMLERDHVLESGVLPACIRSNWQPLDKRGIVLTGERKLHILDSHPELDALFPDLVRTVLDPDEVHRNKRDSRIAILWREIEGQSHLIRVANLLSEGEPLQHSVMSAWRVRRKDFEREVRQGRRIWRRGERA